MKDYNDENSTNIYINEDLIASRAKLFLASQTIAEEKIL